jgi:hypothetical protein
MTEETISDESRDPGSARFDVNEKKKLFEWKIAPQNSIAKVAIKIAAIASK